MPGGEGYCEFGSFPSWVKFEKDSSVEDREGDFTVLVFGGIVSLLFLSRSELVLYEREAFELDCDEDEDCTGVAGDEQDCGKCGCRNVSGSSFSHCGKVIVSEDADCDEI